MKNLFITGIDTDAGKTVVSAILTEMLKANYWKPVQAGELDNSDTLKVKRLITNTTTHFFEEAYKLTQPMSPHAAAAIDNVTISIDVIAKQYETIKSKNSNLIIEGAGGVMVPLNETNLVIDLIDRLNIEVVVVLKNYLGSINHSILTLEALQHRNIPIYGVVFNGESNLESENFILKHTGEKCIGKIPISSDLSPDFIRAQGNKLRPLYFG